jgi:3-(3-hydroxy-phenyl)propionate hydroxylase
MVDAPIDGKWLNDLIGNRFQLMAINADVPDTLKVAGVDIQTLSLDVTPELTSRYLGDASSAVYLMRPDQHVAARWTTYNDKAVADALRRAIGLDQEAA